jgi:hypothetical protein
VCSCSILFKKHVKFLTITAQRDATPRNSEESHLTCRRKEAVSPSRQKRVLSINTEDQSPDVHWCGTLQSQPTCIFTTLQPHVSIQFGTTLIQRIYNLRSESALIPQSLQLQAQVTLASLSWCLKPGRCAKSCARRSVCFHTQSGGGASMHLHT